jgi:hypothetical protein
MPRRRKAIGGSALVLLIVAILAVGVAAVFAVEYQLSAGTNNTPLFTTTSPCTAPGVTCGGFIIDSAYIFAGNSSLSITITNNGTGNGDILSFDYYINNTDVGKTEGLSIGSTYTYSIFIPSSVTITSGQTYFLNVEAFIPGANMYSSVNITAS